MNRQKRHKQKQKTKRKAEKKATIEDRTRRVTLEQIEAEYAAALGEDSEDSRSRPTAMKG